VNDAGEDSEAEPDSVATEPLPPQSRVTVTLPVVSGTQSLNTPKLPLCSVLEIVQPPPWPAAGSKLSEQWPIEMYPAGVGLSVAVQLGLPVNPVTWNVPGEPSEMSWGFVDVTVPLRQMSVTLTCAELLSEKSLETTKSAWFSVLVIVHEALPLAARATPAQLSVSV
jgi:hypothetical protein